MKDQDTFFLEEEFLSKDRKERKKEKKIAKAKDRSKFKKSDVDQKKKHLQPKKVPDRSIEGRVLSISKQSITISTGKEEYSCFLKGALKKERSQDKNLIAVGDLVYFLPMKDHEGQILLIKDRYSFLAREDVSGRKQQLLAVNIDQVFIVTSIVEPPLKPGLIDRYLIASKKGKMHPIILINKLDLLNESKEQKKLYEDFLVAYESLGIAIFSISALTEIGISSLKGLMANKTSVFSGQSGVGKSTILNVALNLDLKTGDITSHTHKGSHTTTRAEMIRFSENGYCVDTPGIKTFGIWKLTGKQVQDHFFEITKIGQACKYPDCRHDHEPDCAVKIALEEEKISQIRFDSYKHLMMDAKN